MGRLLGRTLFALGLLALGLLALGEFAPGGLVSAPLWAQELPAVGPVPANSKIPKFYSKQLSVQGYPIVASDRVNDFALREAGWLVEQLTSGRPGLREALIAAQSRLCIIAHNEFTTDLPEFAQLPPQRGFESLSAKDYWDARARGTGGNSDDPLCSCGEENLLGYEGDPYSRECILIHEFAHNIHLLGMPRLDPTFDERVKLAWQRALKAGLWKGAYASVNHHEYFAEGAQSWFDNNRENDHDHNHVNTRAELLQYDPALAGLCREVFGETRFRYTPPRSRLAGHLAGYRPEQAPKFAWPERLQQAQAVILKAAQERSAQAKEPQPAQAAAADPGLLTIDRLYRGGEFQAAGVDELIFSRQSASAFRWRPADPGPGSDLVKVDLATDTAEVLIPAAKLIPTPGGQPLSVHGFRLSDDERTLLIFTNSRRVWRTNARGEYWVYDIPGEKLTRLGPSQPPSSALYARLDPTGTRAVWVHNQNLFTQKLPGGEAVPLTHDTADHLINGTGDWVNEEELEIREGYRLSGDGRYVAFRQFDTSGVRSMTLVDNLGGNYPKTQLIPYPKVGEQNSATRVGIVSVEGGSVRWLDLPGDPRGHYIAHLDWSPDSSWLLIQQFNRLQNRNTVYRVQPETGEARVLFTETDAAWVENENRITWLRGGEAFLWMSERSGWRQLNAANSQTGELSRVTTGDFDVIAVERVVPEQGWVYFSAAPNEPTRRYLHRARLDGSAQERVTPADATGWNTYQVHPLGEFAVHSHSTFATPPVHTLVRLPGHEVVRVLQDNAELKSKLETLRRPQIELVRIETGQGEPLDAWVLTPPDFQPDQKYPLLLYAYGEPAGQTVRDEWMGRSMLWHWLLAQHGYVVASIDNRGTPSPRGREFRKAIHRQIGRLAAADQAAAVRTLLRERPTLDPRRVGIWGWSGGGSTSLNSLLQYPQVFSTAIAVACVPDQKLYDTIYQERYMGLPDDNAEGYRLSSPITWARQLEGNLLLLHGTTDDNVHYQGVEQLIDELVAHHKNFTVLPYPGRSHGIGEGRNTSRHLHALMLHYWETHLKHPPANPQFSTEPPGKGAAAEVKDRTAQNPEEAADSADDEAGD